MKSIRLKEARSSAMVPTFQWPSSDLKKNYQQQQQQYQSEDRNSMRMVERLSTLRSFTQKETLDARTRPYVPPPRWSLAMNCRLCAATFGYFKIRHHCRHCGASVCGRHSRLRVPLKHLGLVQPQRVCGCCFDELQKQLHVRGLERVTPMEGADPDVDNGESDSIYSTNSMRMRACYRRRSKSVYSEPVQYQRPNEWRDDYDNDSKDSMNGFTSVAASWHWNTASSATVESLQPKMGSMFVSVAPLQLTVLERRHLSREQLRQSMESESTRRKGRQPRSRPHSSALDTSLHVQRLCEVKSRCTSDEQEMEQRVKQLVAARREFGEISWRDVDNVSWTEREKLELDGVTNKHWRKRCFSPREDEDEDEEAEIAATLAFMNGGRRMSCTADLLGNLEPPLDLAVVHYKLGETLLRDGDFAEAVVELRLSVEVCNNNAVAWLSLAKALDGSRTDSKAAEEAVCRALELEPASVSALSLLGKLLHLRGEHDDAIRVFRQALKLQCPVSNPPGHAAEMA